VKHFPFHTPNDFSQPHYIVVNEAEISHDLKWEDNLIDGACLGEWISHHIIQNENKNRIEVRLNGEPYSVLYQWMNNEVHLLFQSHFIALDSENTMMAMVLLNELGQVIYYYNRNYSQLPYFSNEADWYLEPFSSFCNQSTTLTAFSDFLNDAFEKKANFFRKEFAIVDNNKIFVDCLPLQVSEQFFYCFLLKHNPTQQEMGLQLGIQEKKFNRIIDNFQLGLLEVNNVGVILNANQSFCKMSGYSLSELMGKDAGELLLNDENREMMRQINQKRSEGYTDAYELCIRNKKGEKKWWLISGAPNIDEQGHDNGSIGIHWDITIQKELEFSLQKDKQKAEAIADFKTQFLANMSHEIRTPLNAIVGMIRELKVITSSEKQTEYLNIADVASEALLNIINDVLDFSKLEAGKVSLEQIDFTPSKVMQNAALLIADRIAEKKLDFQLEGMVEAGLSLMGDPNRLQQCLLNILSNAAKFTHVGKISLGFEIVEENENQCTIDFTISDTGVGMDPDFMNRVFEKFSQADETITRKYGGSGLGLSITKSFVEMMGGRIQIESKKHVGTRVHLNIPFQKSKTVVAINNNDEIKQEVNIKGMRVLVVEDNALNRAVARAFLTRHDIQVTEAFDGIEALSIVERQTFDLIFMDIQMPGIDGIEVCSLIRDKGLKTPIIALTANAQQSEKIKCEKAGMNDYLVKPFQECEILQVLNKYSNHEAAMKSEDPSSSKKDIGPSFQLQRIQDLVGDDVSVINSIVQLFVREGSRIANEVEKAIHENDIGMIRARLHELRPNLHNMGMDKAMGYLENFRAHIIDDKMVGNAESIGLNMVLEMRVAIKDMQTYLEQF
jgi:PAS domain S-box-containing protein